MIEVLYSASHVWDKTAAPPAHRRRSVAPVASARELMLAALYWRLSQTQENAARLARAIAHLEPVARDSHAAVVDAARSALARPRDKGARQRLARAMEEVWRTTDSRARRRRYWWEDCDA